MDDPLVRKKVDELRPENGGLELEVYRFVVGPGERRIRLDLYLDLVFKGRSRAYWKRMIDRGVVKIDGQPVKGSRRTGAGDLITIEIEELGTSSRKDDRPSFEILYEDDHVIAVNKRAGAFSHPVGRLHRRSVITDLRDLKGDEKGEIRPCHRLDRFVSGLILHGKGAASTGFLGRQFFAGTIRKGYLALVEGVIEMDEIEISKPVGRDPDSIIRIKMGIDSEGKESVTQVRVEERFREHTLVALSPKTGRRHQLRLHLASIGHPIVNDPLYGQVIDVEYFERQQFDNHDDEEDGSRWIGLHSHWLNFVHPGTKERMTLEAPPFGDFADLVSDMRGESQ